MAINFCLEMTTVVLLKMSMGKKVRPGVFYRVHSLFSFNIDQRSWTEV